MSARQYQTSKRKFLVRAFFLIVFISSSISIFGQTPYRLDEQFNSAPTLGAGWSSSGAALSSYANTGTSANFGRNANALGFNTSGQIIKYGPWVGSADLIFFDCVGISGNGSTFLVEESATGLAGSWSTAGTASVGTTLLTFQAALLSTSRYIQITFTKNTVNSALDDLRIRSTSKCTGTPINISSVLINGACGTSCENDNEFITFQNGSYRLHIDSLEIVYPVSTTSLATGAAIGGFGNADNSNIKWLRNSATNTAYTAFLNTTAGCTMFLDIPANNIISANAKVMAFTGSNPDAVYNFSATCGTGSVYVVYANKSTCDGSGKLPNGSCSAPTSALKCSRYVSVINNNTGCIDTKSYVNAGSNSIGTIYYWGSVNSFVSASCNSFKVLPIELLDFYATKNNTTNDIVWKVAQEEHILYYTIEKSSDAVNFTQLATVYANNEMQTKSYSVIDDEPFSDITYYRLSTMETNGLTKKYNIISVDEKDTKWQYTHYQTETHLIIEFKNSLPKNSTINLYDLSGKVLLTDNISQSQTSIYTEGLSSGIYFIQILTPYKTENFKISISKN